MKINMNLNMLYKWLDVKDCAADEFDSSGRDIILLWCKY